MAINKKLIHFNSKDTFEREKKSGNILDTSIVFIKDSQEIYTHGEYYSTKQDLSQYLTKDNADTLYIQPKNIIKGQFIDQEDVLDFYADTVYEIFDGKDLSGLIDDNSLITDSSNNLLSKDELKEKILEIHNPSEEPFEQWSLNLRDELTNIIINNILNSSQIVNIDDNTHVINNYLNLTNNSNLLASQNNNGVMSKEDKIKLDELYQSKGEGGSSDWDDITNKPDIPALQTTQDGTTTSFIHSTTEKVKPTESTEVAKRYRAVLTAGDTSLVQYPEGDNRPALMFIKGIWTPDGIEPIYYTNDEVPVATANKNGVMEYTDKRFINYRKGVTETDSIFNINTNTHRTIIVEATEGGLLTLQNENKEAIGAGVDVHIVIHNASSSDIIVQLPNHAPFVLVSSDSEITIAADKYAEVNILSDGTKFYVRAIS